MPKFWPTLKPNKSSHIVKYHSHDLISMLEHTLFRKNNSLSDVPNIGLNYIEDYKNIRIEIITNSYQDYENFNWINVNYFMSDFNNFFPNIKRSFWFVEKATPKYSEGRIVKVEYILHLDEWSTFYKYIYNMNGTIELLENHNKRWIKDKDGRYIPDLINNPYINACNEFCRNIDYKQEFLNPVQLYDTKHFDLEFNPNNDINFFVVENGEVKKQMRGCVLVWAAKSESGNINITLLDNIAMPLKLYLFPVFDKFNNTLWIEGIKHIEEQHKLNYKIQYSNEISDIIEWKDLRAIPNLTNWYESIGNEYRISQTNGFIDNSNNFIEQFSFTKEDIINKIIEPHIHSLTHIHYELQLVNKIPLVFDINRLIKNKALIIPPNEEGDIEHPLIRFPNKKILNMFLTHSVKTWFNAKYKIWYMRDCYNNQVSFDYGKYGTPNIETIFKNGDYLENVSPPFKIGYEGFGVKERGCSEYKYYYGKENEYLQYTQQKKGKLPTDYGKDRKFCCKRPKDFITFKNFEYTYLGRHSGFNEKTDVLEWDQLDIKDMPWYFNNIDIGYVNIRSAYNYDEMENAGPYNSNVIGYKIYDCVNGRFRADKWYVVYNGDIYEFPIGQLEPKIRKRISLDNFWYNNNIVMLTKNIGFFSPEEMGLKFVLLDTDTTTSEKINTNKMNLVVKGAYTYPYFSLTFVEFMKKNVNQFNAGFANIDAKKALDKKQAWANFGTNLVAGIGGGAIAGGMKGGPAGAIGGGIIGGAQSLFFGGVKTHFQLSQIELNAQCQKNMIQAQINDAKNLTDNINVVGTSSTISDTSLKQFIKTTQKIKNYWNYWAPSLHKYELNPTDRKSIINYFNKYGYKQNRILNIYSLEDLLNRYAFNRIKISNPFEILTKSGLTSQLISDVAEDLINGIWVWDLDNVKYEDVLDYTINNYEKEFYIDKKPVLDTIIENEVN